MIIEDNGHFSRVDEQLETSMAIVLITVLATSDRIEII